MPDRGKTFHALALVLFVPPLCEGAALPWESIDVGSYGLGLMV